MLPKKPNSHLSDMLLAVATLIGIDRSIDILAAERGTVQAALAGVTKMTVGDLANAVQTLPVFLGAGPNPEMRRLARRAAASHARAKKSAARKPRVFKKVERSLSWNGSSLDARRICSEALAKGPKPIRIILTALHKGGVVRDESPTTRREVEKFLAQDKTFAIRTRGTYAIRSKAA